MSEDESVDEGEGESGRETEGEFWFWFRLDLNLDSKCRWGATVAEASVRGASVMEPSTRKRKENTRFITKSIWDMKLSWNKSTSFEICCLKNSCHKFRFLLFETIFFLSIVLRNFTFSVIYYSKFNFSTFFFRTFTLSKFYPSTFFFRPFCFRKFFFRCLVSNSLIVACILLKFKYKTFLSNQFLIFPWRSEHYNHQNIILLHDLDWVLNGINTDKCIEINRKMI
jgi:hypothetical protein